MGEIAGIIYPSNRQPSRALDRALRSPHPTPPGSQVISTFDNVQLGCQDASCYADESSTSWAAIDGELSNAKFLIEELQLPANITTAEIVASAYHTWGPSFVSRLEGEYVIALFDKQRKELFLIRDRLGQKPIYWYNQRDSLVFGTQIKGLLRTGLVPPAPALDGIAAFLFLGFIPQDLTPMKGVNRLLPAYYLTHQVNGNVNIQNYWSYSSFHLENKVNEREQPVKVAQDLLHDALTSRIRGKKHISCIWDGSREACLLAASLSQLHGIQRHIYVSNADSSEPVLKELEAKGCVIHLPGVSSTDPTAALPKLIWELDEPLAAAQAMDLQWAFKSIAEQKSFFVSCAGGSSVFGPQQLPQPRRNGQRLTQILNLLPESVMLRGVIPFTRIFNRSWAYDLLRRYYRTPLHSNYLRSSALFIEQEIREISPMLAPCFDADVFLHKFHHIGAIENRMLELMYFDAKTKLPDSDLFTEGRLCHNQQLNWCSPLIDTPLAEYLAGLPAEIRCGDKNTAAISELLIREMLQLPDDTAIPSGRPKLLGPPIPLLMSLAPRILDSELVRAGILNRSGIRRLLSRADQSERHWAQLWALLTLEVYYRLFIMRPLSSQAPETNLIDFLRETNAPCH